MWLIVGIYVWASFRIEDHDIFVMFTSRIHLYIIIMLIKHSCFVDSVGEHIRMHYKLHRIWMYAICVRYKWNRHKKRESFLCSLPAPKTTTTTTKIFSVFGMSPMSLFDFILFAFILWSTIVPCIDRTKTWNSKKITKTPKQHKRWETIRKKSQDWCEC